MNGKAVIVLAVFAILITMLFVKYFPLYCNKCSEGFQSPTQLSCPSGTKSFSDRKGNLLCCNGEVNGFNCEGVIVCGFSGNLEYPECGLTKRSKYIGPINPFVKQMMSIDHINKFSKLLDMMNNLKKTLVSLPPTTITSKDLDAYNALLDEENSWYSNNLNSNSRTYQEECMYIIQRLTATFSGKPLMTNPSIIQEHVKKQMCSSS